MKEFIEEKEDVQVEKYLGMFKLYIHTGGFKTVNFSVLFLPGTRRALEHL